MRGSIDGGIFEMKKILWCGGSHLGNAANLINSTFSNNYNEYYITAAPRNRDWSKAGGRYFVDGSIVGNNAHEPHRRLNLNNFDRIIFVGQYIQPQRYVNVEFKQLLSSSLLDAILERDDLFLRLPGGIFNEPISLFPRIAKDKCVLLCDPWLRRNDLPIKFMERFTEKLSNYCAEKNMLLFFQPDSTLEKRFSTHYRFSRSENNRSHFNDEFWRLCLQDLSIKIN